MYRKKSKSPPKVALHPASVKYIKQNHPWITEDTYTRKFPHGKFLVATDRKEQEFAFLLQDKSHHKVKARVWSLQKPFPKNEAEFYRQLYERLERSINKRLNSEVINDRENYYLVFGEADQLPGLQILAIKNKLFLIYYAFYWKDFEQKILNYLQKLLPQRFDEIISQERTTNKKSKRKILYKSPQAEKLTVCREFGINYEINSHDYYDLGLYTDMSSIRHNLTPIFQQSKSVLNLYCYTGAYSLYALAHNAQTVYSVDLSSKYLKWLDRNLTKNPQLDSSHHHSLEGDVIKVLDQLIDEKKTFDFIICDPPTFSSDGKKQSLAIRSYEKIIPKINRLLNPHGHVTIFLNTHTLNRNQFNKKIEKILIENKLQQKWILQRSLKLSEDAYTKKGFPEGDYLKGSLFKKESV